MQLLADLSQQQIGPARRLFTAALSLDEAGDLFAATQDYGSAYLVNIIEEIGSMLPEVKFDPAAPAQAADQLLRNQGLVLTSENVDHLEEAIEILVSGCAQTQNYVTNAREFNGRREYLIELDDDDYDTEDEDEN